MTAKIAVLGSKPALSAALAILLQGKKPAGAVGLMLESGSGKMKSIRSQSEGPTEPEYQYVRRDI